MTHRSGHDPLPVITATSAPPWHRSRLRYALQQAPASEGSTEPRSLDPAQIYLALAGIAGSGGGVPARRATNVRGHWGE
jgi:hypothetical protein